jgi:hypothetical protein
VRFELFTAVTMKNAVFLDVGSKEIIASIFRVVKSKSSEPAWAGGCRLSHQSKPSYVYKNRKGGSLFIHLGVFDWWFSLQPPAHAGSSLSYYSTLKMETIRSFDTSVHTRSTRRHIPEDGILQRKRSLHGSLVHYYPTFFETA